MSVFIIFMQGVYRHDIFGPFDSVEAARAAAERKSNDDDWSDGYHGFVVAELRGNEDVWEICEYRCRTTYSGYGPTPWPKAKQWKWDERNVTPHKDE
jgi:hypothetical protein